MTRTVTAVQYLIAALIGLYLGAGQHIAYTSATVTVSLVATVAARRSTRAAHESAGRTEPVQSVAVTSVVEHDLDRHVDLDLVGLTVDDVRHHAGTLV